MAQFARVDKVQVLRDLRVAVCKFADVIKIGLDESDAEIQQMQSWLKNDRLPHWSAQARLRQELLTRAKLDLSRKQAEVSPLGGHPSCVDEKKALQKAKLRLEEAETKLEHTQRWIRELEREAFSYKGSTQALGNLVVLEVPVAIARLDQMIITLEAYTEQPAEPAMQSSTAGTAETAAPPANVVKLNAVPPTEMDKKVNALNVHEVQP
ncbi:MAG: hypothetical protein HJJLKODD_00151 [Phycisphaerae bacterium]|nr:hypothetical protein [Phycisphaerae bacterium]